MRRAAALIRFTTALIALMPAVSRATAPALFYQDHALIGSAADGSSAWELWLDPNGRFSLLYDRGAPARPRGAAGPFRYRAWHGAFQLEAAAGGVRLCLRPDAELPPEPPSPEPLPLLAGDGCTDLPLRPIGEVVPLAANGRHDQVVLLQFR